MLYGINQKKICMFPKLIFWFLIFWFLLHVSNPRVHLQEEGCIYSYCTVRFTCFSISSLVGRRVYSSWKWILGFETCGTHQNINPLNPELNPICYLLALLGAYHFLHVSRIRFKSLTLRQLMSYIYGAPILDVSRSHTITCHKSTEGK